MPTIERKLNDLRNLFVGFKTNGITKIEYDDLLGRSIFTSESIITNYLGGSINKGCSDMSQIVGEGLTAIMEDLEHIINDQKSWHTCYDRELSAMNEYYDDMF